MGKHICPDCGNKMELMSISTDSQDVAFCSKYYEIYNRAVIPKEGRLYKEK